MTHVPSSALMTSILFCLLRMIVDRWKKDEFLSFTLSQSSLDFCLHKTSLYTSHSDSLAWRLDLMLPLCLEWFMAWTIMIFWIRSSILDWQCPKTSLFHLRRAFTSCLMLLTQLGELGSKNCYHYTCFCEIWVKEYGHNSKCFLGEHNNHSYNNGFFIRGKAIILTQWNSTRFSKKKKRHSTPQYYVKTKIISIFWSFLLLCLLHLVWIYFIIRFLCNVIQESRRIVLLCWMEVFQIA